MLSVRHGIISKIVERALFNEQDTDVLWRLIRIPISVLQLFQRVEQLGDTDIPFWTETRTIASLAFVLALALQSGLVFNILVEDLLKRAVSFLWSGTVNVGAGKSTVTQRVRSYQRQQVSSSLATSAMPWRK